MPGELPFEGSPGGLPVVLKIQKALSEGIEVSEVIRCQYLSLHNREVDLDLVEPTGMDWRMHKRQAGIAAA